MSLGKKLFIGGPPPDYDFAVASYTGNGSTNAQSIGMQPDLVFLRNATTTSAYATGVFDSTRGATKLLNANGTDAETTDSTSLTSFDSNGFTLGSGGDFNANATTFNSFSLEANGGTTSSNTDGSITSTVQANTAAGFSIIKFVGTGASATVGHGLNSAPELMIYRNLDTGGYKWPTHTQDIGSLSGNYTGALNERGGFTSYTPTTSSTTIGLAGGQADRNGSGQNMLIYAFHSVSSYSKLGTYTGNASTNAITVGFLPKFLMVKKTSTFGTWYFWIASGMTEQSYGYSGNSGMAISSTGTLPSVEFRSDNGGQFVLSGSDYNVNASGATFIYWCVGGDKTNVI